MSKRERLRVSFNLENPQHVQALEQLSQYDSKQRSEYIIACILAMAEEERMEKLMTRLLDERLGQASPQPHAEPADQAIEKDARDTLPASLVGFLDDY